MQSGGLLFVYKILQSNIRNEMAKKVLQKDNHYTVIQLAKSDYEKCKQEEFEIVYKGKLYDIHSIVFKKDIVELSVLNDTKEEQLVKNIEQLKKNNSSTHKTKLPNQLISLLTLTFLSFNNSMSCIFCGKTSLYYQAFISKLFDRTINVFSPPPELA